MSRNTEVYACKQNVRDRISKGEWYTGNSFYTFFKKAIQFAEEDAQNQQLLDESKSAYIERLCGGKKQLEYFQTENLDANLNKIHQNNLLK